MIDDWLVMDRIAIPSLVKRLRQRLGLTQEQLAHEVGVTFSTVNQWENGPAKAPTLSRETALGDGGRA